MRFARSMRIALSASRSIFHSVSLDRHTPVKAITPLTLQTPVPSSVVVNSTSVLVTPERVAEALIFLLRPDVDTQPSAALLHVSI